MRKLLVFATVAVMSVATVAPSLAAQRSNARAHATTQRVNPVSPFGYDAYARGNGYFSGADEPRGFGNIGPRYGYGPYPDRPYGDPDRD